MLDAAVFRKIEDRIPAEGSRGSQDKEISIENHGNGKVFRQRVLHNNWTKIPHFEGAGSGPREFP